MNALNFPLGDDGFTPPSFSSDFHAFRRTKGLPLCKKKMPYPMDDMLWGLLVTAGASHNWHINSDGYATFIRVKTGMKWWIIARPRHNPNNEDLDFTTFADISMFLNNFDTTNPNLHLWELEAVLLEPGTTL